jgi:inorganic pyrophosphatase
MFVPPHDLAELYEEINQLTDAEKRALDTIIRWAEAYPEALRDLAANQGTDGVFRALRELFNALSHD